MALIFIAARTLTGATAPSLAAITSAFRSARLTGNEVDRGNWIGPGPRVTRAVVSGTVSNGQGITVGWVYGWPSAGPWNNVAPLRNLSDALVVGVRDALNASTGAVWEVAASPFDPARNGPVEWWESGGGAATVTANAPVAGANDTPFGPAVGTGGLTPTGGTSPVPGAPPGTPPSQGMSTGTKVVLGGAAIVAIGGAVWYFNKSSKRGKRRS